MRILIGGSSSKINHLKEFANYLEKIEITTKVVLDIDYSDGYPSRKISKWFKNNNQFKKLINEFKPDFIFIDRQRHFGLSAIIKNSINSTSKRRFLERNENGRRNIIQIISKKNGTKKMV